MKGFYKALLLVALCGPTFFPAIWAAESSTKGGGIVYAPDAVAYYPSYSKRNGEKGVVDIRLVIGVDGTVTNVKILKSSGYERLDEAAQKIGSRYRFNPLTFDGEPQAYATELRIRFGTSDE